MQDLAKKLSAAAQHALHEELITYPKPGLVSHIDPGSHHGTMHYDLFVMSIQALGPYFEAIAELGIAKRAFSELQRLGVTAEKQMLFATDGVNTHRGAIFVLGLVVAATAYCLQHKKMHLEIGKMIQALYAEGLSTHRVDPNSHGSKIRATHHLESILDAAKKGFPLIFSAHAQFSRFKQKYDAHAAKLRTLFYIMQHLDDTNLVHRGGIEGLHFARSEAKKILDIKEHDVFMNYATELHQQYINKNLSPGGSADLLATVIFIEEAKKLWV